MKTKWIQNQKDRRHGTANGYSSGCRCPGCTSAHNEYQKRYHARPERVALRERTKLVGLPLGDERHGTRNAYNMGCRCPMCREIHRRYGSSLYGPEEKKAKQKEKQEQMEAPNDPRHGTTTGYARGCRCERCIAAVKEYYTSAAYRAKNNARIAKRRKDNPNERLILKLRKRTTDALRKALAGKGGDEFVPLIGCSYSQLKEYIASQFSEGMTTENYGRSGWVLDHVKPLVCFDFSREDQLRIAFHYTNTQPLWNKDNMRKNAGWRGLMHRKEKPRTWIRSSEWETGQGKSGDL